MTMQHIWESSLGSQTWGYKCMKCGLVYPHKGSTSNDLGRPEEYSKTNLFFPCDSLSKFFSWRRASEISFFLISSDAPQIINGCPLNCRVLKYEKQRSPHRKCIKHLSNLPSHHENAAHQEIFISQSVYGDKCMEW